MSVTKVRGNIQIQSTTITNDQFVEAAGIETTKLAEGSDLIKRSGSVSFTGNLDLGNNSLTNLATPIDANDLTRKSEFDAVTAGVHRKQAMYPEFGDGSNTFFQTDSDVSSGTEKVYVNGILQKRGAGADYTISNRNVTFSVAPANGDVVTIEYLSGAPIVSNGTVESLFSVLGTSKGGTGQTTAQLAINAIAGSGTVNQVLMKDSVTGNAMYKTVIKTLFSVSGGGDLRWIGAADVFSQADSFWVNYAGGKAAAMTALLPQASDTRQVGTGLATQKLSVLRPLPNLEGTWGYNYTTGGSLVGFSRSVFTGAKIINGNIGIGNLVDADLNATVTIQTDNENHIKLNVGPSVASGGSTGDCVTMIFNPPGTNDVYISGFFSQKYSSTGISSANYSTLNARGLVKWNGSTLTEILDSGSTNRQYACAAADSLGNVYFGGSNGIWVWNGTTLTQFATATGNIQCMFIDASNNIFALGGFTVIGGQSINRAAKYNGSTWVSMGTGGVGSGVGGIAYDGNGNIYAGSGNSVLFGGVNAPAGLAKYNIASDTWTVLPNTPLSLQTSVKYMYYYNNKLVLAYTPNFSDKYKIFQYDPATNTYGPIGKGLNGGPFPSQSAFVTGQAPFTVGSDGKLYVATLATLSGGNTPINGLARYENDDFTWTDIQLDVENFSGQCWAQALCAVGNDIYVGGFFEYAGGVLAKNIAKYNIPTNTWSSLSFSGLQQSTGANGTLTKEAKVALTMQGNLEFSRNASIYTSWGTTTGPWSFWKNNGTGSPTPATTLSRMRFSLWTTTPVSHLNSFSPVVQIANSTGTHIAVSNGGTYRPLYVNSQIFATSSVIATSDVSFKENIHTIDRGLDYIQRMNPVSFFWKPEHQETYGKEKNVGFIAQEIQYALDESGYSNSVVQELYTDDSGNKVLGLVKSDIIPFLVKGIQELDEKKKELQAKLAAFMSN